MSPYRAPPPRDPDPPPPFDWRGAAKAATLSLFGASLASLVFLSVALAAVTPAVTAGKNPPDKTVNFFRTELSCRWHRSDWQDVTTRWCEPLKNGHVQCGESHRPTLRYHEVCENVHVEVQQPVARR